MYVYVYIYIYRERYIYIYNIYIYIYILFFYQSQYTGTHLGKVKVLLQRKCTDHTVASLQPPQRLQWTLCPQTFFPVAPLPRTLINGPPNVSFLFSFFLSLKYFSCLFCLFLFNTLFFSFFFSLKNHYKHSFKIEGNKNRKAKLKDFDNRGKGRKNNNSRRWNGIVTSVFSVGQVQSGL